MPRRPPRARPRCFVCGRTRHLGPVAGVARLCPRCRALARRYDLATREALERMRAILRREHPEGFTDRGQFAFDFLDGA